MNLPIENSQMVITLCAILFTPVTGSVWWFVTAYVFLILFAPSINMLIGKLNKKGYALLLVFEFLFMYILGKLNSSMHDLETAIFFYCLGGYHKKFISGKRKYNSIALFTILMGSLIAHGMIEMVSSELIIQTGAKVVMERKILSMIQIALVGAIVELFFCFFETLNITSSVVNKISRHTFGVYLFHMSPIFCIYIFGVVIKPENVYISPTFYVYLVLIPLMIYFIGSLIDIFRERTIEPIFLRGIDRLNYLFETYCKDQ